MRTNLDGEQRNMIRRYIDNGYKLESVAYGGAPIVYYDRSNEPSCAECAGKRIMQFLATLTLLALFDQEFMDDKDSEYEESEEYLRVGAPLSLFPDWQYHYTRGEWLDHDGIPSYMDAFEEGRAFDCDCGKHIEACYGDPEHYGETGELCDNPECIECEKLRK